MFASVPFHAFFGVALMSKTAGAEPTYDVTEKSVAQLQADMAANAAMDRLHLEGEFNHHYCNVETSDLRKTLKRFYRRFYLRPAYLLQMITRIRNFNMLRNTVLGGLNVFVFSTQESQG